MHHIGEVIPESYNLAGALAVTVECGLAESTPLPVVAVGAAVERRPWIQARLSWDQASRLADLLADARRRYE
jgi:hypothetical protein